MCVRMRTRVRIEGVPEVRKKTVVAFSDRSFICPATGRSCVLGVSVRVKPSNAVAPPIDDAAPPNLKSTEKEVLGERTHCVVWDANTDDPPEKDEGEDATDG